MLVAKALCTTTMSSVTPREAGTVNVARSLTAMMDSSYFYRMAQAYSADSQPAKARSAANTRVSIIGSFKEPYRTDGGVDLFDCAAQGRIDAFFLSGGQIDGEANINLNGIGSYPCPQVRWSGAFGSAYLYFLVPRVILFREEHTRRVFVPRVDFISAPGVSAPNVYRPGGPYALETTTAISFSPACR